MLSCFAGPLHYVTDFQHPWRRIRARADLPEVRIHDLRHTYASMAASGGVPIQMVGRLLGHSQLQTTMRYAHRADDPVLQTDENDIGLRQYQLFDDLGANVALVNDHHV
jgi:integrase